MKRWIFLSTLSLVGLALIIGQTLRRPLSETQIINHFAAEYVQSTGGDAAVTDCHAVPGPTPAVWLVIRCVPVTGAGMTFLVGPRGQRVSPQQIEGPQA